jgi:hydrogenase-4 component E
MLVHIVTAGLLFSVILMAGAKRLGALIRAFRAQSLMLAILTASFAWGTGERELWIITAMILVIKVWLIPRHLEKITDEMSSGENMGLVLNPPMSVAIVTVFGWLIYVFSTEVIGGLAGGARLNFSIAFLTIFTGLFLMVFRLKALAQIIGLLVMENGVFMLASSISGGMPFIVEIAVFFDLFVLVVVAGIFVYRIKGLFTHIDVSRLARLKG